MVKKRSSATSAGAGSSSTVSKAAADAAAKAAPEASAAAMSVPGDWPASTTTKRDVNKARSLGLISDVEGNVILPAPEKASAQSPKRSSGGFADEDDLLLDFDEGFVEPPPKKAKATPATSEASVPPMVPSAPSVPSKEKEISSAAVASSTPSEKPGIQTAITILKDFASQFSSLQVTNTRLQEEAASSSSKLDRAITIGANALREVDVLKKELDHLKKKMKEEEKAKAKAEAQTQQKE
ncbi:hypothetical protein QYE76_058943 [Lolium multiflorum]|uniref:Uncharacterized protein n=1 Tax=Lolium multiflorum TaxID=4521 RepID=A0AAD8T7G5_LOLMU|nr:hypothetical protein QYE76_058943 [Lolium multiflorum]